MATSYASLYPTAANITDMRLYVQFISNAFAAGGWVQITGVGEINPTTFSLPAAGANAGYQVWRTNDGLTNWCLKVTYQRGGGDQPLIQWQIGTGVDGSGNLTGQTNSSNYVYSSVASATLKCDCFASAGPGRISFVMYASPVGGGANVGFYFNFERSRDASGAEMGSEVLWVAGQGQNSVYATQVVPSSGPIPAAIGSASYVMPQTNFTFGANVAIGLIFAQKGGLVNPFCNFLMCYNGTIATYGVITVNHFGSDKVYRVMSQFPYFSSVNRIIIRWE